MIDIIDFVLIYIDIYSLSYIYMKVMKTSNRQYIIFVCSWNISIHAYSLNIRILFNNSVNYVLIFIHFTHKSNNKLIILWTEYFCVCKSNSWAEGTLSLKTGHVIWILCFVSGCKCSSLPRQQANGCKWRKCLTSRTQQSCLC